MDYEELKKLVKYSGKQIKDIADHLGKTSGGIRYMFEYHTYSKQELEKILEFLGVEKNYNADSDSKDQEIAELKLKIYNQEKEIEMLKDVVQAYKTNEIRFDSLLDYVKKLSEKRD